MNRHNTLGAIVGIVAGLAVGLFAADSVVIVNDQSLANAAAYTNGFVLNGKVLGVAVRIEDCASAARTNTVAITSADGQTIFSATVVGTTTSYYPIATLQYSTAGAVINSSTVDSTTNRVYAPPAVASKVTATVTGVTYPTLTNSVTVRLIMDR
jgi:hypothetical protein